MKITYKKLWVLLAEKEMKKKDLQEKTGLTTTTIAKLGVNGNVNTNTLLKICEVLDCDIADIMGVEKE